MHQIEPYYNWRDFYVASEDERSPFFQYFNSEFYFTDQVYDYLIHPQWDNFGSSTLYLKVLYCDYEEGYTIIEFIGEWNDAINNDIMFLKRDVIDPMLKEGICKFILIVENVLNFHYSDDCYYEEWFEDILEGWISLVNARQHVLEEFNRIGVDQYFLSGGQLQEVAWRTYHPSQFYTKIDEVAQRRLGMAY
jgi:hypothetical protein